MKNSGFVELTSYHGNEILINRSAILEVFVDENGICKLYLIDFENSIALSGSYDDVKKLIMEG